MILEKQYEELFLALKKAFQNRQITYDEFHLMELDLIRLNRKISNLKINKGAHI